MNITMTQELAKAIGKGKLGGFSSNWAEERWVYGGSISHPLGIFSRAKLAQLDQLLDAVEKKKAEDHVAARQARAQRKQIKLWLDVIADAGKVKLKTVEQFASALTEYLRRAPGHRLHEKSDDESDIWLCYYVGAVVYYPKQDTRDGVIPAYCDLKLFYNEFGGTHATTEVFRIADIHGSVPETLARRGLVVELPERRERYLAELKRFGELTGSIGRQCWAIGTGTDDLDGNTRRSESWYYHRTQTVHLVRGGQPTRVVVDVFRETDEQGRRDNVYYDSNFWRRAAPDLGEDAEVDDIDEAVAEHEEAAPEIPTHPLVAVFDMTKHVRLRVHVSYLTDYEYDHELADKLILPETQKALVKLLVEHRDGGFVDLVRGKSGGAVVLLAGPPGTGKTLTAEVYAEAEGRPLYSVQCSQLGTDPEALEDELLKVFTRARRWNAVMLLDEADVYVHERGNDMQQNAIVGVFLRVLEYQGSVLFLTTNRPDDVDDAIASRCVARLSYAAPSAEEQAEIWRVLAEAAQIPLDAATIRQLVADNPGISGRDVKNLLKLARLLAGTHALTVEHVAFARQFKPTMATGAAQLYAGPLTLADVASGQGRPCAYVRERRGRGGLLVQKPCRNRTLDPSGFCYNHIPAEVATERAQA